MYKLLFNAQLMIIYALSCWALNGEIAICLMPSFDFDYISLPTKKNPRIIGKPSDEAWVVDTAVSCCTAGTIKLFTSSYNHKC
jgi:hypothetical protein